MTSPAGDDGLHETGDRPFAVSLEELEASVRVPLEEQVTEQETEVPLLPSEAERRRAEVMRVITRGG